MRIRFVLGEVWNGLRKNIVLTVAVIVAVAVSLSMFGAGLLIREQVSTMKGYWYDKVEVSVFLCTKVSTSPNCKGGLPTDQQRQAIHDTLTATPNVQALYFESQAEAYNRFRQNFKDSPDLVNNVTADQLPESFRVKLVNPNDFQVVEQAVGSLPGVEQVSDQRQVLDRLFAILAKFQAAAIVVAAVQLLAAALLIGNTIRVAAHSRRREMGIMRLVGASNGYIQAPFVLEGMIAGLVGAAIACGALALFYWQVVTKILRPSITFVAFIGWESVIGLMPLVIGVGVGIAAVAAFTTMWRFLRV